MGLEMRIEVVPPRYFPIVGSRPGRSWCPWIEVALRVRAHVAAWDWREESWIHWAVPAGDEAGAAARRFDPVRRAAVAGEPPEAGGRTPALDADAARTIVASLVAAWTPVVHHLERLGLTSQLDEEAGAFRRRCLAALGPAVRAGSVRGAEGEAELARLLAGLCSRRLGGRDLEVLQARVGVAWYPSGWEPRDAGGDLLVAGGVRGER